jgi:predicted nucleotidyltransferase component of viral defense system
MTLDVATYKNILIRILKDIYSDITVAPLLGFKGGTAAYMFYSLNRFSMDLDFDLLDNEKVDYVFERIGKIISEYGKIKSQRKKRFTLFWELSSAQNNRNIKVEINRRNFGSRYELATYFGISMKVMVKEDMFAHKLVALVERSAKANRDIFDVYFFLKNQWPINKMIVETRTKLPFEKLLQKCIGLLNTVSDRKIVDGLGELLDTKQKDWVKTQLRKETIFLLQLLLSNASGHVSSFS